nr:uncharacterized protein LOC131776850 [Pocillopora verrucosa]
MPKKINCLPYIFFILYHQEAKYVIPEREPRDNIWIYHCKCVEGLTAASSVYVNCIHIEATEKLIESFDKENNVTPSLAGDAYSHDHTYQEEHHDLLPLTGNNFTIFVCGNKQQRVVGL